MRDRNEDTRWEHFVTDSESEPQLQAPSAGLPRAKPFFSRLAFRTVTLFLSRKRASQWCCSKADRMCAHSIMSAPRVGSSSGASGLEDSSRYWSAYMMLEHLVIVDAAIAGEDPGVGYYGLN